MPSTAQDAKSCRKRGLAARIAGMPAGSVAAVKRVVDVSLTSLEPALVAESDALAQRFASGEHRSRMQSFLEAGRQTRSGELHRMAEIVGSMLEP